MNKCSWETWVIPKNYSINWHDEQSLLIGITGYGNVDSKKLKITLYSEDDSKIKTEGEEQYSNNTYILAGDLDNSSYYSKPIDHDVPNHIFLETDQNSLFKKIYIKPGSPGQKKLDMVLTYFDGEHWVTKKSTFEYKALSFAEKHQTAIIILAIIGGVVALDKLIELMFSYV